VPNASGETDLAHEEDVPMARQHLRRLALGVATAGLVLAMTASAALAGEVTGSGANSDQNQGVSWCSFSGLNDRAAGEGPTDTQSQSFGQDVKAGIEDPRELNPGVYCNPNRTFLPPNPNRTH
jgi:hypothetical protein